MFPLDLISNWDYLFNWSRRQALDLRYSPFCHDKIPMCVFDCVGFAKSVFVVSGFGGIYSVRRSPREGQSNRWCATVSSGHGQRGHLEPVTTPILFKCELRGTRTTEISWCSHLLSVLRSFIIYLCVHIMWLEQTDKGYMKTDWIFFCCCCFFLRHCNKN